MKKLFLTLSLAIAAMTTFSQTINYGIKGGFNLSDQSINDPFRPLKHQLAPGYNIGAIVNADFGSFTIQPALSLTTKGVKYPAQYYTILPGTPNEMTQHISETTITAYDIEFSANVFYNIHAAPGAVIQLGGGPSIAHNFHGNATTENPSSSDPGAYGYGIKYNNPEFGVNFIAGVKLKKKLWQ